MLHRRTIMKCVEEDFTLVYEAGTLEVDPVDGRVRCHICGRYYVSLAIHVVMKHHLPLDEYRDLVGLNRGTSLVSSDLAEKFRTSGGRLFERLRAEGKSTGFDADPERLARAHALSRDVLLTRGQSLESQRKMRELVAKRRGPVVCVLCGDYFDARHPAARYCQPCKQQRDCRKGRAYRQRVYGLDPNATAACRSCAHCGVEFTSASPAKWCPECRPEMKRQQDCERERQRRASRPDPMPAPPRQAACARCCQTFVPQSNAARYCLTCRRELKRQQVRGAQARQRQRAAGLEPDPISPPQKPCEHCGETFTPRAPSAKYCPSCKPKVRRQQQRDLRLRLRGIDPAAYALLQRTCIRCGQIVARGTTAKYCSGCRAVANRDLRRERDLARREAAGYVGKQKPEPGG